jgi:hypothetical protein
MKTLILGMLSVILLGACSHSVYLHDQNFHAPVTQGEFGRGGFAGAIVSSTEVELLRNVTSTPPDSTTTIQECSLGAPCVLPIGFYFDLGLLERIDFVLNPASLGLKYQWWGSKGDGWKSSLYAGGGGTTVKDEKSSDSSSPVTAETKLSSTDLGLSFGYQKGSAVYYLSYNVQNFSADTKVTQTGGTFQYESTGQHQKLGLGMMTVGPGWFSGIELTGTKTTWSRAEDYTDGSFGLLAGYRW